VASGCGPAVMLLGQGTADILSVITECWFHWLLLIDKQQDVVG
jgi:hypothetical protein